jgi:hypothetical protein
MTISNETELRTVRVVLTNGAARVNASLTLWASPDVRRDLERSRSEAALTLLSQAIRDARKLLADDSRQAARR